MTMVHLTQALTLSGADMNIRTHVIHRAARMGWCMAGESAAQMPRDVKDRYPDIPWNALRELRDIYTHLGEKHLGDSNKSKARAIHLTERIATTPGLAKMLDAAIAGETGQAKIEFEYIRRGLRYGMALHLMASGQSEFTAYSRRDPKIIDIANGIRCAPEHLPVLIGSGCGRMTLLETGDYLGATSMFVESMDLGKSLPGSMRDLRNRVSHFKDIRATNDGFTKQADKERFFTSLQMLTGLTQTLGTSFAHDKYIFDPAPISKAYYDKLTLELTPQAIAYLDHVVERVTSVTPANTRFEQATILAAAQLLATRPFEQASSAIDTVLNNRPSIMQRDSEGVHCPASFALSQCMRELVTDIQKRCKREHEASLI
jgi:hypothetical protein